MNPLLLLKVYLSTWVLLIFAAFIYTSAPAFIVWLFLTILIVYELKSNLYLTRAILSIPDYLKRLRPTSYFIRGLSGEKLQLLSGSGVNFLPELQNGAEGIRVSRRYRGKILSLLKARIVSTLPLEGRTHEMVLAARRRGRSKFTARLTGKKLSELSPLRRMIAERRLLALVRNAFLPELGCDIIVHCDGKATYKIPDDGLFHIFIWAGADGDSRKGSRKDKLFGLPIEGGAGVFDHQDAGVPLLNDSNGFFLARLVNDSCLFVHYDAVTTGSGEELALLSWIFDAAKVELAAEKFLLESLRALPADGLPIGDPFEDAPRVTQKGFEGKAKEAVMALSNALLVSATGSVHIELCSPGSRYEADLEAGERQAHPEDGVTALREANGQLNIFFRSAPPVTSFAPCPEELWGQPLLQQGKAATPSGCGIPIFSAEGFPVAELLGNNLYVLADLIQYGSTTGIALLTKLFWEVRQQLIRNLQQANGHRANFASLDLQHSARSGLDARQAEREFRTALKWSQSLQGKLLKLQTSSEDAFGPEFDQLCNMDKVLKVRLTDSRLVVTTDTLFCVDPRSKKLHEIGAFKITIGFWSESPHWENLTRTIETNTSRSPMHAPHISQATACLGNTGDRFARLISGGYFADAVEMAIAFIETVNTDDLWGAEINKWPVAHQVKLP